MHQFLGTPISWHTLVDTTVATMLELAMALVVRPESDSDSGSGDNLLIFKKILVGCRRLLSKMHVT